MISAGDLIASWPSMRRFDPDGECLQDILDITSLFLKGTRDPSPVSFGHANHYWKILSHFEMLGIRSHLCAPAWTLLFPPMFLLWFRARSRVTIGKKIPIVPEGLMRRAFLIHVSPRDAYGEDGEWSHWICVLCDGSGLFCYDGLASIGAYPSLDIEHVRHLPGILIAAHVDKI